MATVASAPFTADDGAPDDVAAAVAPFLAAPRIRFIAKGNHGVSAARNTAIAETSASLIALLDGYYWFRPDYLSTKAARLEGDLKVYLKAQQRLPAQHPVQSVVTAMIGETQQAFSFEHELLRITAGEFASGLTELRAVRSRVRGPVWTLSFALWRVMTALARPMLGWRQRAMARETKCPALAAMLAGGGA